MAFVFILNNFIYNWTDFKQNMSDLPHHPVKDSGILLCTKINRVGFYVK